MLALRRLGGVTVVVIACVAAHPSLSRATITREAQAIVDRYVEATGGRAALDRERAVRVKGRVHTSSLRGTYQRWTLVPDRFLIRTSLGKVRVAEGYDGTTGWRTDLASKRVTILEGKELDRLKSRVYFENEMWARADQGGGDVRHGSQASRGGQTFASILVSPPVGPSRRLWFSTKTGLIDRIVGADVDGGDSWAAGHAKLAGRKRITTISGGPEMEAVMEALGRDRERMFVDSAWVNADQDTSRFAPPQSRESAIRWGKTPGVAHLPFRYGSRHVWVRASINGAAPADFIIDTGASMTVLDRDYAQEIHLAKEGNLAVQGMGGSGSAALAEASTLRLSAPNGESVTVRDVKLALTNLAETTEPMLWRRLCGIIGFDVLSRFVVELDYDRHIVTFRDPKGYTYTGNGQALDLKVISGLPVVHVKLDNRCGGDFIVDVGSSFSVILHGSLVRRCQLFGSSSRKQIQVYGGGVGDAFLSWLTRLDEVDLGPYQLRDPVVGLTLQTRGVVGSSDYVGNIGCGVLDRFICTFDATRRKLYLEPGKRFGERDPFSRLGVRFARYSQRVVPVNILSGSPAAEAGLKLDDEVTAIDGRPVVSFTAEELDRLYIGGTVDSEHTITVLRDNKTKRLTLKLRDVL